MKKNRANHRAALKATAKNHHICSIFIFILKERIWIKNRQKKKEDKEQRKQERKQNSGGSDLDSMLAYVNEFGEIVSTPPEKKQA